MYVWCISLCTLFHSVVCLDALSREKVADVAIDTANAARSCCLDPFRDWNICCINDSHSCSLRVPEGSFPIMRSIYSGVPGQSKWNTVPLTKVKLHEYENGSFCCGLQFVYHVWLSSRPTRFFWHLPTAHDTVNLFPNRLQLIKSAPRNEEFFWFFPLYLP